VTLAQLINRPCTIVHRLPGEDRDEYGNRIPKENSVDTVCELQQQPGASFRSESEDQVSDTRWVLFLPAGTDVAAADTVTIDGDGYELLGDPWPVRNPRTGVPSHIEAPVKRTDAMGDHQ
jgi:hypothetical protein